MFGTKNDEILTCFLLIIIGYTIAKMFGRGCEGFNVGFSTYSPQWYKQGGIGGCYYGCKGTFGERCPNEVFDCNNKPNIPNGYLCEENKIFPDSCIRNPNAN